MAYTIPLGIERITWKFYIIHAFWNFGIMAVIWVYFVETKSKTMEQINCEFEGTRGGECVATKVPSGANSGPGLDMDVYAETIHPLNAGERKTKIVVGA